MVAHQTDERHLKGQLLIPARAGTPREQRDPRPHGLGLLEHRHRRHGGVWSHVHIEDAATATAIAVERGQPGIYNIVDDEPRPADASRDRPSPRRRVRNAANGTPTTPRAARSLRRPREEGGERLSRLGGVLFGEEVSALDGSAV
jgi:hypothetical protein